MGVSSKKDLPEPAFAPSPPLSASPGTAAGSSDCELDAHANPRQAAAAHRRRPRRIESSPSSISTSRRRASPTRHKQQFGREERVADGDLIKAFGLIRASWLGRLPADLDSPEWHVLHLSASQYLALCARLEDSSPALRRYFDETLRHDYNPARGILVLRLMAGTALHEFLQENIFQFVVTQISQAPARVPGLADVASNIKNLGHTKVILDANIEETVWAYKCPDRQLRYIGTDLPQFAMEVGYSQKAESLQQLAREYYEDSDGEVKTVLTFNVAYSTLEKRGQAADRTASFSLYRGDERIHKDKVFRDAQGKSVANGCFQLLLTDFVPDTVLEQLDEQRRCQARQCTIDMSSELLNEILEEADKFQALEDDRLRRVKERLEQRRGRERDGEPSRKRVRWGVGRSADDPVVGTDHTRDGVQTRSRSASHSKRRRTDTERPSSHALPERRTRSMSRRREEESRRVEGKPPDPDNPPQQASSLKFQLVCDPEYDGLTACQPESRRRSHLSRQRKRQERQVLRPIRVCRPEEIMTGRHKTYDLGWAVAGEDLPRGTVRLTIGGKRFARLPAGGSGHTDPPAGGAGAEGQVPALLSCFKVNGAGEKVHDPRDKKWSVSFCTDLGSRYLTVQTPHQVPFWCSHCGEELAGQVRACKVCEAYSVCYYCYLRHEHPEEHSFSPVINIDV